ALPGVQSVASVDDLPLMGGSTQPVALEGRPVVGMADQPEVAVRRISPEYLSTMRIPLLQGRGITAGDNANGRPVVLISESMAHRLWQGEDPFGGHLTLTFFPGVVREVVGIVADVKMEGLNVREPVATLYAPIPQMTVPAGVEWHSFGMTLAIRA